MNEDKMPLFLINGFLEAGKKPSLLNLQCSRIISETEGKTLHDVLRRGRGRV